MATVDFGDYDGGVAAYAGVAELLLWACDGRAVAVGAAGCVVD